MSAFSDVWARIRHDDDDERSTMTDWLPPEMDADIDEERMHNAIQLGIDTHPEQERIRRLIAAGTHRTYMRHIEPQTEVEHPGDTEVEFYLAPILDDEEGEVVPLIRISRGQLTPPPQG
jgi:hypothetical protein